MEIGEGAFNGCTGLNELRINAKHPRRMERLLKYELDSQAQITLYVPNGTEDAYRRNRFFSKFKEILAQM